MQTRRIFAKLAVVGPVVPTTFPGEGSANLSTGQDEATAAYEALRHDLARAAGSPRRR